MTTAFGTDLAGVTGIGPTLQLERNPATVLVQALARRLTTSYLWYDPDGAWLDVRSFIGTDVPEGLVASSVVNALIDDDRVANATATVTKLRGLDGSETLRIEAVAVTEDDEQVDLTLLASDVSVELLNSEIA